MLLVVTLITTVLALLLYRLSRRSFFEENGIPHSTPWRAMLTLASNWFSGVPMAEGVRQLYTAHSPAKYVGSSFFGSPGLVLCDLDLIKQITVKHFDHFVNHQSFIDPDHDPIWGNNVFFLHDSKWREVRNLLTPAFTSSKLKGMYKLMSDCAETFADYLANQPRDKPFVVNSKEVFTRYSTDVIGTCAFGVEIDSMRNPDNEFYTLGKKATDFGGSNTLKLLMVQACPRLTKMLGMKMVTADVAEFFTQLVRETIAMRDERGIVRPDLIQLLMESRSNEGGRRVLTVPEMTAQAFVFFFGGFESTSTFMCFVAQMLAEHPEVQERLRKEVDDVFDEHSDHPPYDVVSSMVYLDAVVNETLRMYPINAVMDRVCTKEFELPPPLPGKQPVLLKPGFTLWIPYYAILRDPKLYPHPGVFNPDRFIDGGRTIAHAAGSLAFGLGPRMCIGNRFGIAETKALLVHIVRRCRMKPAERMITPMVLDSATFRMQAKGGFWLELTRREKSGKSD